MRLPVRGQWYATMTAAGVREDMDLVKTMGGHKKATCRSPGLGWRQPQGRVSLTANFPGFAFCEWYFHGLPPCWSSPFPARFSLDLRRPWSLQSIHSLPPLGLSLVRCPNSTSSDDQHKAV